MEPFSNSPSLSLQELIDDFIFPASNVYLQYVKTGEFPAEQAIPVCSSPATINAGFELLVALAVGCVRNLKQIVDTLTEMYYQGMYLWVMTNSGFPLKNNLQTGCKSQAKLQSQRSKNTGIKGI